MILADQHTHCNFSTDSDSTPESMIRGAIQKGLTHLCLTDHMDLDYPGTTKEKPLFEFDPEAYFKTLLPLKEKYSTPMLPETPLDKVPFFLAIGIELGLRPGRPDLNKRMHELLAQHPFDFVLGSIHLLDNDDPYYEAYWKNRSKKDILTKYFNDMYTSLMEYDNFDSLGHLDYLIRYIPAECGDKDYLYHDYKEIMVEILRFLIQKDKALEINTAGLVKGLSCFHPKLDVLKQYRDLGGKLLTIGSDAHTPEMVATEFSKSEELLKASGFEGYYVFKKRSPVFIPF